MPTVSMSKTTVDMTAGCYSLRAHRMKRLLARAALLLAACALASCARAPAPAEKDTLYRHLDGDPATLDPITTTEEYGILVEEMIFRPLLALDARGLPAPGLARSWTMSPD